MKRTPDELDATTRPEPITDLDQLAQRAYERCQLVGGFAITWEAEPAWLRQAMTDIAAVVRDAVCPPDTHLVAPRAVIEELEPLAASLAESIRLRGDDATVGVYFPVPQVRRFVGAFNAHRAAMFAVASAVCPPDTHIVVPRAEHGDLMELLTLHALFGRLSEGLLEAYDAYRAALHKGDS